jgi:integrase
MRGHIRKRGDAWEVRVDLTRDPVSGKRRQLSRTVRGRKRDAEAVAASLISQNEAGIDTPRGRQTVGNFLQQWLRDYAKPNTAPKTFRRYEQIVRIHLTPVIGEIRLSKLRPLHIQAVYRKVDEKGLSARTALHCHRVLREALHHAVRWQLLSRNPADAVESPRPLRYEIAALGPDDLKCLLDAADQTNFGPLVTVALLTGLRTGELLGLRWQDVDFDNCVLRVQQTCQWIAGEGFIFRQPKSHRSTRPVALSPDTVEILRQRRVASLEERLAAGTAYEDKGLVFADALGRPIHPSTLRQAWLGIVKASGMDRLRFHDLRHAHASLLMAQGVHPKIVSERLGHSSVSITLDIYSHVAPGLQAEAAAGLDALLQRKNA